MRDIKKLSKKLIPLIAAGEVVERPSSVLKELLENSIDANATVIEIDIKNGGKELIKVTDDGEGMSKTNLLKSFLIHTTSKTYEKKDLFDIKNLGFRGEALASIAAVSKLEIKSKPENQKAGYSIETIGGEKKEIKPVGMPKGTTVTVKNLFFNTPARKKSLKTTKTEFNHIVETVVEKALAYPKIKFKLQHNKKKTLNLNKNQTLETRIKTLLGTNYYEKLIPISYQAPHLKIRGFIGKPQLEGEAYLFVNNRCVKNRKVTNTLKGIYKTLIESGKTPVFILFIEAPNTLLDINIHPRKEEVKFHNFDKVEEALRKTVGKALSENSLIYKTDILGNEINKADEFLAEYLKENVELWNIREETPQIIQVNNLYIICATKKGLLIVDQHAAHEKILYEQLVGIFEENKGEKTYLDKPQILELSVTQTQLLKETLGTFKNLGFEIEDFGPNTFKIYATPKILKNQNMETLIKEILKDLKEETKPKNLNKKSLQTISFLACRSAIKEGDRLTEEEAEKLIKRLQECEIKYTCPHGRPAMILLETKTLNKMFKR